LRCVSRTPDARAAVAPPAEPALCDCHVHVFGSPARFPLAPERRYTPPQATIAELRAMLARIGAGRVVLVQPSPYATDNRCLLETLAEIGIAARGVVDARSLRANERRHGHELGVRGLRDNAAASAADNDAEVDARLAAGATLAAECGWHLEVNLGGRALAAWTPALSKLACPVVLDHFGYAPVPGPDHATYLRALATLLDSGKCWVKLSAPYRLAGATTQSVATLLRTLASMNPQRLVWGSDWPHTSARGGDEAGTAPTQPQPFRAMDPAELLARTREALEPDAAAMALHRNAQRLYDFD
jgi:predicted TIM-barrel fold metal-dependent hydrolase